METLPVRMTIGRDDDGLAAFWTNPPAPDGPLRAFELREMALALLDAAAALEHEEPSRDDVDVH